MAVTDGTECFILVRRTRGVLLLILCLYLWGSARAVPRSSCDITKQHFLAKGYASSDIPEHPVNGEVCGVDSCCGPKLEHQLTISSKRQLDKFLKESLQRLSSVLDTRAKRFDEFFRNLMTTSKKQFHEMFKRTYGVIYLQHSFVFTDFFEELERYYNSGRVRLAEALDTFFGILYQRMFTVINAQYQFDDRYMECVAEHITELMPFGDVPHKLGIQLRRSFVATRAFYKALAIGAEVARNMATLKITDKCGIELVKMQHCDKCLGIPSSGSCSPYCISTLKECLYFHNELDAQWNNYVDGLDKVANRLLGPFNVEMVVEPINVKISEAVMNFQEKGTEVSEKIFSGCGNPKLLQRRRREVLTPSNDTDIEIDEPPQASARKSKNSNDEITFESLDFNTGTMGKKKGKKTESTATMDKLIHDIKQRLKDSRQFWSQLPYQFCNSEAAPPSATENCWNGTSMTDVSPSPPSITSPPILNQQIFILRSLISKLQLAYQGQDVDLADDSDDVAVISGSGSGTDDEDDLEGSGNPFRVNVPEEPVGGTETSSPPSSSSSSSTESPPKITGGSPSSISGLELTKALAHYLLPIVLVWFGGAFTDFLL